MMIDILIDCVPVFIIILVVTFFYHYFNYLLGSKKPNSLRAQMLREWMDK